jgi:hypothetical protein
LLPEENGEQKSPQFIPGCLFSMGVGGGEGSMGKTETITCCNGLNKLIKTLQLLQSILAQHNPVSHLI